MYKKVINCLKEMLFDYRELDKVIFNTKDFTIRNVIEVEKENSDIIYLEFKTDGSIWAYDLHGNYQYEVRPDCAYKMTFELSWLLNN